MTAKANLERRGRSGVWYFRRVVPADLQRTGARAELRISVGTNRWEKAVRAARYLNAACDQIFEATRIKASMLTQDELNEFMREMLVHELAAFEALRPIIQAKSDRELDAAAQMHEDLAAGLADDLRRNNIEDIAQSAFSEVGRQGLNIDPRAPEFNQIARAAIRVMQQVELATANRLRGSYDDDTHYRALGLPSSRAQTSAEIQKGPPPAARRKVSEVYADCRAHQLAHKLWTNGTARSKDISLRYFIEAVGDLRFDKISADDVAKFDRELRRQPANIGRGIYAGLTMPKACNLFESKLAELEAARVTGKISAAQMAKALEEPWAKRSEPNNQTKHINSLSSLITWANNVMRWNIPNYCDAFRLSRKARKKLAKKRTRLPIWWLQKLLLSPMFTGHSPARKSRPGSVIRKDGDYWSVLIAMFHGCRLDEGGRLTPGDISREYGIWCVSLSFDDSESGSGKTEAANRKVPIHSTLIKLGLVTHAKKMQKKKADWLFPEMTISKHQESRAGNLTKRLLTYKRTMGLYEKWKDQHAFRHTMNNRLRRLGVPEPVVKELLGWSREGMSGDEYFTASTLAELQDALDLYDLGIEFGQKGADWQIVGAHPMPDFDAPAAKHNRRGGRQARLRR
jgi:integrase